MKVCLFICILGINSIGFSQPNGDLPFSVDIKESAMFFDFTYYINSDSIYVVKKTLLPAEKKERYIHRWSEQEKVEIIRLVQRIKIQNLKTSYYRYAGDDYPEFTFYFNIDGYDKKVVIYKLKIRSVADFVSAVNKGLPENYKIGYNEGYFGK